MLLSVSAIQLYSYTAIFHLHNFDNSKYNVLQHSGYQVALSVGHGSLGHEPFNRSPNHSSNRDHVSYGNIPQSTTRPPAPALSANRGGAIPYYTRCNLLYYRI